ncbi:MAG: hypothetical protein KAG94_03900 [Clostridiales bacterium]|nr:hypothetical protein [Clostridiales bacterium]
MKKLSLIILLFIFIVGCSKTGNIAPKISQMNSENPFPSTSYKNQDEVDSIDILYPIFTRDWEKLENSDWEKYFFDIHGIKLHIEYVNGYGPSHVFDNNLEGVMYLTNGNGFFYNQHINLVLNKYEVNTLNKYYEEYNWYQYIDSKYILPVTKNGEIKAVPCISNQLTLPRYYNKKYLTMLDMDVPDTISGFSEYLSSVKQIDSSFYPMYINVFNISQSTSDIFRAFGTYIGVIEESAITYNPITSSIEDGVFSPNFESGLQYIRMLEETKLLKIYNFQTDVEVGKKPNDFQFATAERGTVLYNPLLREEKPDYEFLKGYYLVGINHEYLVPAYRNISYYVFPKTISNMDGTVALFNQLITDRNYFYDLQYGIEGINYTLFNNHIDRDMILQLNQIIPNENPTQTEIDSFNILNSLPEELYYELNSNLDMFNLMAILSSEDSKNFNGGFFNIMAPYNLMNLFNDENSVSDNIEVYKNEFAKYQIGNIINQMNDNLGFKTIYDYQK